MNGGRVRAEVLGWKEAQSNNKLKYQDPRIPSLEGVPQFVEGILCVRHVPPPLDYDQYLVDGRLVDPLSIQEIG